MFGRGESRAKREGDVEASHATKGKALGDDERAGGGGEKTIKIEGNIVAGMDDGCSGEEAESSGSDEDAKWAAVFAALVENVDAAADVDEGVAECAEEENGGESGRGAVHHEI